MLSRRAFVAGTAALSAAAPRRALAFVDTTTAGGPPRTPAEQARMTLDAVAVVAATHLAVRRVWHGAKAFPEVAPIAFYAAPGQDADYPRDPVIWLNADHPELISPRVSRLTDEIPLLTELLLASVDVRPSGVPALGLEKLDPAPRRAAATALAGNVAVIAKYAPYPAVSDEEFARLAFPFAVLRQATPGIGGVVRLVTPPQTMPPEEPVAAYVGSITDPRVPKGFGAIRVVAPGTPESPEGKAALMRAFVLATADRQPADSAPKRAYDAARAKDEAAKGDRYAARRAFAAPYATQVAALLER